MNVIVVKKNNKEIGRLVPSKKSVLIGRSPVCDLVLRSHEMKPLHFLVEWLGEGDFDPRSGMWSLVDISSTGRQGNAYVGEAHILQSDSQKISDYEFSIEKDGLAESAVAKGVISRSMGFEDTKTPNVISSGQMVFEIVTYDLKNDVITQVNHFSPVVLQKGLRIASLPKLFFKVEEQNNYELIIENQGETQLLEHFNRLEKVTDLQSQGQKIKILPDDFHVLRTADHAFYIRWVPKVSALAPLSSWLKDPILMTFLGALIFGLLLSFFVQQVPFTPEVVEPVQRVARIEVQAPPPEEVVEAPPQEIPQTASPPPVPDVAPEKPVETEAVKEADVVPEPKAAPKAKIEKSVDTNVVKSKPLPIKAPVQDVNKMGLLGRLKSKNGSGAQVRADQVVNKSAPVDTASGDEGSLTINQAPLGQVGLHAKAGTGSSNSKSKGLESASTSLKTGKVSDGNSVGGISGSGRTKFGTSGNELGGKGAGEGVGGFGDSGKANLDSGSMEVEGGLTKDDIRKALAENRRAIRNCYERSLLVKKDLQGRLTLKWRISPAGSVTAIGIQNSSLKSPSMDQCVLEIVKGIQFAQAPNKQPTTVIYPFVFQGKN